MYSESECKGIVSFGILAQIQVIQSLQIKRLFLLVGYKTTSVKTQGEYEIIT